MMKRVPRIKFPQRHSKSSTSSSSSGAGSAPASVAKDQPRNVTASSEVPLAPKNTAVGGKASVQPKRTPLSDKEIEAILLGGCV